MLREKSNVRVWAFWGGTLGLLLAWSQIKLPWVGDGIRVNLIHIIVQVAGFAFFAAIAAYIRNWVGSRK